MSDQRITFSPEHNQWTLTDGRHHMEVPEWAREIMRSEFERETRPLRDNLDFALDSKRIAERRVTELLAENAKLRELCKDMMAFVEDDDACERCGHDAECVEAADGELVLPYEGRCLMLDLFADRMCELGVEV